MCGIAGLVDVTAPPLPAVLDRMIGTLRHRGPDGNGVHVDGPCGLAHARLSIIDLSGGAQPMIANDGSGDRERGALAVTFNGEIFNYIELRAELEARGRVFHSKSDTEVILHAYAEWGDACVQRFNGQWSFALWDTRKRRLFCSRDRIGVRPFFWAAHDGRFVFGSEVKALFAAGVPRALDVKGLHEVLTFWCALAPRTVWQGVQELPPGHNLVVELAPALDVEVTPYWSLDYTVDDSLRGAVAADGLFERLVDAARIRLRADVPVGSYLSGGLDSSVIAGVIARHTDTPLETFSVTFEDADYDESGFQRQVAAHLGTKHRAVPCTKDDIAALFPDVVTHAETPLLRTAPAPMWALAGLVRESGYKVVLTGEGADEMLGGYDVFKEAKLRRFWARQPESKTRPQLLKRLYPWMKQMRAQPLSYLRAFFHVHEEDLASPFFSHLPRWRLTQQLTSLFSADVRDALRDEGHDPLATLRDRLPQSFAQWDPFAQAQYLESTTLLPGYILSSQGDRMAMGRSIEGRFPFLDVRVMEYAARLHPNEKMKVLDEKHVLKQAAAKRGLVPDAVRRRPKQPYRAPDSQSFFAPTGGGGVTAARQAYIGELLSKEALAQSGLFDVDAVSALVDKARRGGAVSARDNMGFVFVLSTQLLRDRFLLK